MGPDQPHTLPNDPYSWLQPPHTAEWHFQGGLPTERLLDPSYGTSMRPLSFQRNHLPEPSCQSYMPHPLHGHFPSGNEATSSL